MGIGPSNEFERKRAPRVRIDTAYESMDIVSRLSELPEEWRVIIARLMERVRGRHSAVAVALASGWSPMACCAGRLPHLSDEERAFLSYFHMAALIDAYYVLATFPEKAAHHPHVRQLRYVNTHNLTVLTILNAFSKIVVGRVTSFGMLCPPLEL